MVYFFIGLERIFSSLHRAIGVLAVQLATVEFQLPSSHVPAIQLAAFQLAAPSFPARGELVGVAAVPWAFLPSFCNYYSINS